MFNRISIHSHLCKTSYGIFHQFLVVSPKKSISAQSSTIVIFELLNPQYEFVHVFKYLSCRGLRSYQNFFLVIDTSVAEGAYNLALRVQDLPISLGNMIVFNIDFLIFFLKIYKLEKYIQPPTQYIYDIG